MNKYKKLLQNTGLVAIGTFGSKILTFLMVRFYTECLTASEYSTADLLMQTAKLLIPILCLGITETVFRFALDRDADAREVFTAGLLVIAAGSALFALIIPLFRSIGFFHDYTYILVAYITCSNLHSLATQYIRTKDHYRFYALQGLLNTALTIIFNLVFLLLFKWGIKGYLLAVVGADFIAFLVVFIHEKLWRDILSPKKIHAKKIKEMLRYSIPLIPTTVFWWITSSSDHYMVKYFSGDTMNGLYTAAYKIPSLLVMICTIFIQAWNFSAVVERDERERTAFFSKVFDIYQSILFCACSAIILFSQVIAKVLFAREYYSSWKYIPLLCASTVFSCFVTFVGSVYTVRKKSMFSFVTAMVGALTNIVLNLLLIPSPSAIEKLPQTLWFLKKLPLAGLGATGAAIATLVSYLVVFIIRAVSVRHYVPFDLKIPKVMLAVGAITAQSLVMSCNIPCWYILSAVLFLFVAVLNIRPIIEGLDRMIFHRGKAQTE